ncbi:diguanylate cyclase (GGDEF) domain-containing protein [Klenkia marina]|uniref:Diguanylate cyclase (GGDEF) domain-containing protein n=1 Tax=Klenkia marina TaxID=1960309 RepID=A0A1G4Z1G2_9ACTN|nr:bifunctional diguanylate cyclase/phosphodiesterase [Klenkia marina]SCX59530.1 diguanylate cyclase (GGDEF) domain-containing protein [Klenkia marina]
MPTPRTASETAARRVLVALAVVAVGRLLLPEGVLSNVLYGVVALTACAVAWWAVAHGWRPGAWIAAAVSLSALGDVTWQLLTWGGLPPGRASLADVFFLSAYVAGGIGLRRLLARASRASRLDRLVDTTAVFLVVVYLEWVLALADVVADHRVPVATRLFFAAYPVLDAWLLALVVRLWFVRRTVRAEAGWVALAAAAWFVADLDYLSLPGDSDFLDAGWNIGSVALAASSWAALRAWRTGTATAEPVAGGTVTRPQLALALLPLAVPGAAQLVAAAHGTAVDPRPGIVVAGIVLVLAFLRGARLLEQQAELRTQLETRAFHDVLTGLPNRALLDDRTTHALARSLRSGTAPVVLSLDLDGFKAVNDTLGHPAGDQLLRQVAARLVAHVRSADTVARLGGDEFAVLIEPLPGDGPDRHRELAERLVEAIGAPYELEGRTVRVGVSVGLVRAEDDGSSTSATLMRDVDTALYRAKDGGKGRVAVFAPTMRTELLLHTQLRDDLSTALPGGQLRVVYQPVVDLDHGGLQGFEALLRWEHPELGTVLPSVFIPVAEETGAIVEIGRWVLREACAAAVGWRAHHPDLTVAVNLSVRQLQSPGLVADVATALADTGLPPAALCLELTETALVVDPDQAAAALEDLRALGLRIAVDDFGTGYSSLTHLRRFPVDVLKIDRSFVGALGSDRSAAPLVDGLLELARVMGLDVVAEGVESADQRDHLLTEGCRTAQGWLFSPALERAEADRRVATSRPNPVAAVAGAPAP